MKDLEHTLPKHDTSGTWILFATFLCFMACLCLLVYAAKTQGPDGAAQAAKNMAIGAAAAGAGYVAGAAASRQPRK